MRNEFLSRNWKISICEYKSVRKGWFQNISPLNIIWIANYNQSMQKMNVAFFNANNTFDLKGYTYMLYLSSCKYCILFLHSNTNLMHACIDVYDCLH